MAQVNLAKAKSSFSEYASRAAYTNEHIIITKRGKPFVALISVKDIALSMNMTLITGNQKHFQRVPQITVENWLI